MGCFLEYRDGRGFEPAGAAQDHRTTGNTFTIGGDETADAGGVAGNLVARDRRRAVRVTFL